MLKLYKNIRNRREELGMSQQDLADLLGYKSRSTIAKIESGENDIPQSKVMAFAKALKTTPAYLMGWRSDNNFSNNLKYLVQQSDMTYGILAKKTNIDSRRIIKLVENRDDPNIKEASEIAKYFNISLTDLLEKKMTSFDYHSDECGNDSMTSYDNIEQEFGYGIRRIVELCSNLNVDGIKKVTDYINDLNDDYFLK